MIVSRASKASHEESFWIQAEPYSILIRSDQQRNQLEYANLQGLKKLVRKTASIQHTVYYTTLNPKMQQPAFVFPSVCGVLYDN